MASPARVRRGLSASRSVSRALSRFLELSGATGLRAIAALAAGNPRHAEAVGADAGDVRVAGGNWWRVSPKRSSPWCRRCGRLAKRSRRCRSITCCSRGSTAVGRGTGVRSRREPDAADARARREVACASRRRRGFRDRRFDGSPSASCSMPDEYGPPTRAGYRNTRSTSSSQRCRPPCATCTPAWRHDPNYSSIIDAALRGSSRSSRMRARGIAHRSGLATRPAATSYIRDACRRCWSSA